MIEHTTVSGRPASVAYIGREHEPVEPEDAVLIKVLFTDDEGGIVFLLPHGEDDDIAAEARAFRSQAERILMLVGRHADVDYVQDPETGRFQGSRPHGHGDDAASDTPETDKLLKNEKDITDVTGFEDEGVIGFLTPDGRALNTTDSHSASAKNAGTTLWKVMEEGTARIYANSEFLGIDIEHKPTKDQIKELQTIARKGAFERFAIEGRMDVFEGQVTPSVVREQIERAFASVHLADEEIELPLVGGSGERPFKPGENVFVDTLTSGAEPISTSILSGEGRVWIQAGKNEQIRDHAVEAVVKLGGTQREYVAIVGADGSTQGTRVGLVAGDAHSCNVPKTLWDMMDTNKESRFHFYHNHPLPFPLSLSDVGYLNATLQGASIREDDIDGGWSSASIVGRSETDTTKSERWAAFGNELADYQMEVKYQTGYHDQPIGSVKFDLMKRLEQQREAGVEGPVAADDHEKVPAFLQQHAMMLGLHAAKIIKYEFHPSPWQQKWLKEYSREFSETVEIAEARAAKIGRAKEKWVLIKGQWHPT